MKASYLLFASLLACGNPESHTREFPSQNTESESEKSDTAIVSPPVSGTPKAPVASKSDWACSVQTFAAAADIAEASGAVVLTTGEVMVVGDSGTNGSYLLLDPENGSELESGRLPLDRGASDDLEGLAEMDGRIFAITSSGWIREWTRTKNGFRLAQKSYPLAKWDRQNKLVCRSSTDSNCAQNYEGMCLLKIAPEEGQCAGFAAAKATGRLLCLQYESQGSQMRLRIDPTRVLKVAGPRTLSGCDFDEQGRLWYGNNFFAANTIGYIENWESFKSPVIRSLGPVGLGFDEAIATGKDGLIYRFSDTTGSPSLLGKYICR